MDEIKDFYRKKGGHIFEARGCVTLDLSFCGTCGNWWLRKKEFLLHIVKMVFVSFIILIYESGWLKIF